MVFVKEYRFTYERLLYLRFRGIGAIKTGGHLEGSKLTSKGAEIGFRGSESECLET